MDDIDAFINDINELQKINKYLGLLRQYAEFMLIIKCHCLSLILLFIATKGWQRKMPNGFDLLLIMYIAYVIKSR